MHISLTMHFYLMLMLFNTSCQPVWCSMVFIDPGAPCRGNTMEHTQHTCRSSVVGMKRTMSWCMLLEMLHNGGDLIHLRIPAVKSLKSNFASIYCLQLPRSGDSMSCSYSGESEPDVGPNLDSDSEETTSSSHESEEYSKPQLIDLNITRLEALHAASGKRSPKENVYAQRALCPQRVLAVLTKPNCKCGCKVPKTVLIPLLKAFWLLTKAVQDSVLWSVLTETKATSKRIWSLGGRDLLCIFPCAHLDCLLLPDVWEE